MLLYKLKHIKHSYKKAVLAFIFFGLLISAGCGKRKPPLPPIERVAQRAEIDGFQRGSQILLSWAMAPRNAADGSALNISRVDVYRLTETINNSNSISEEDFASRSTLIASLPVTAGDFANRQMTFADTLNFAGQQTRIRYAIRFVNETGQKAGFSNFLLFQPTAKVAGSPSSLTSNVSQNAVDLRWIPPTQNIDGSVPPNILGFNVYRFEEKGSPKLLNSTPVSSNSYADKNFEFNKRYTYFLRSVSLGANGEPLESVNSESISVEPKDVFAPGAPGALTIAASPNTISLFFASNTENDVVGYRVYRSTDRNLAKSEWTILTPQLLTTNTFQDTNVESGKTYYYYLTAVDKFGNVSEPSDVVGETVP